MLKRNDEIIFMRRVLFIFILLNITTFSCYSMTLAKAVSIYHRVAKTNFNYYPDLRLTRSSIAGLSANAEYRGSIWITAELLRVVRNDHEMAVILGHELAHYKYPDYLLNSWRRENMADLRGAAFARKAGYNVCIGMRFTRGLKADSDHPSGPQRYNFVGC